MDSLKSLGQRAPFKRTQTGDVQKSESKDYGVAREKEVDLPAYSQGDVERRESVASYNISGVHDDTQRKLKPRHIQLIGIGGKWEQASEAMGLRAD